MTIKDKTILIGGMMFNVIFFLTMMMSVFITNAVAIAMVASAVTYLFFDKLFYTKRLIPTPMSNSQTLNKNIQLNHITGGTYMQEVTLSLKEYNNLLKDSRDLMLISLENKHLKDNFLLLMSISTI